MELYKNEDWKEVTINNEKRNIPLNWNINQICNVFLPEGKSQLKAAEGAGSGSYPFFNCSETQKKYSNNFLVDGETIFITTGGDFMYTLYFNGKAAYSTDVWAVKVKNENTKFLNYFLKSNFDKNQEYFRGFKFKHLDKKGFNKMSFSLPHVQEQDNIVEVLSSQEKVIEKTKEIIKKLDKRNQFMIDELLSGRLRIKEDENGQVVFYKNEDWKTETINYKNREIPNDWSVQKVSSLFFVKRGKVISKTFINENKGDYPVYSSATTNNGSIGNINTFMFNGEFLTWNTDGYAGAVFYRNGKFNCTNVCGVLEPKSKINGLFVLKNLLMDEFQKFVRVGAQLTNKKLMSNVVENIEFIFPNDEDRVLLNTTFLSLLSEKEKYEQILKAEEKKFDFLLEELMSGRLRIKK